MSNLQLTLSILKPTALKNPFVLKSIQAVIQENNFEIVQNTTITLTKALAAKFYEEHQGKFFYNRLQTFMCRWFKLFQVLCILFNNNKVPKMEENLIIRLFHLADPSKYAYWPVTMWFPSGVNCWDQPEFTNPPTRIRIVFVAGMGCLIREMYAMAPIQLNQRNGKLKYFSTILMSIVGWTIIGSRFF